VEKYCTVRRVRDGIMWHIDCVYWIAVDRIQSDCILFVHGNMLHVPQHSVTCSLPVLVCRSLTVRTAADNSKIKLQAVAPCAVRTAICVVAMKVKNVCNIRLKG